MTKEDFNRQVRGTAFLSVALVAFIVFGALVLASGDWIPGAVIVASATLGLARQIPVIRELRNKRPDIPRRRSKPAN